MINTWYYRFRRLITRNDAQNRYSGGYWPDRIRDHAARIVTRCPGRIIELGCGEGLFLKKLAPENPNAGITGVDYNPEIITHAAAALTAFPNISFIAANALITREPAASYDYCFCLNTTLNQPNLGAVSGIFAEAARLLKPGGILVFDIRNAASVLMRLQFFLARWYDPGIQVPLKTYTPAQIEQALAATGFTDVAAQAIGFPHDRFAQVLLYTARHL